MNQVDCPAQRKSGDHIQYWPIIKPEYYADIAYKYEGYKMTGRDLKAARIKLVGDHRGAVKIMAEKLETAYRTYQSWEARKGSIPGVAVVAVKGLLKLLEIDQKAA